MMRTRVLSRVLCGLAVLAAATTPGCGGGSNTYNPALAGAGAPTFQLAASPASRTVAQGQSTTYAVTLTSVNGFSSAVTPSVSGLPAGASGSFSATPVTPTAGGASTTLTVTTTGTGGVSATTTTTGTDGESATTPPGTSTLTITGTGGGVSQNGTVSLVVTGPGSLTGTIQ